MDCDSNLQWLNMAGHLYSINWQARLIVIVTQYLYSNVYIIFKVSGIRHKYYMQFTVWTDEQEQYLEWLEMEGYMYNMIR